MIDKIDEILITMEYSSIPIKLYKSAISIDELIYYISEYDIRLLNEHYSSITYNNYHLMLKSTDGKTSIEIDYILSVKNRKYFLNKNNRLTGILISYLNKKSEIV